MIQKNKKNHSSGLALNVSAFVAFTILVGLGSWQLQRKVEKENQIAQYQAALQAAPRPFPLAATWAETDFTKWEWVKVSLDGQFRTGPELHLYTLLPTKEKEVGGPGWSIIMPFDLMSGGTVLVNRGFVPNVKKNPLSRPESVAPRGVMRLEGLIRLPEKANPFTPDASIATNEWYVRDPKAFALQIKGGQIPPIIVDQTSMNVEMLPVPTVAELKISNRHLEYALTWFALAAVLVVIVILFKRKPLQLDLD